MSKEWGIEAFIFRTPRDEQMALARWHTQENASKLLPPLQVQGIPGEYVNEYTHVTFSGSGAWYVASGIESAAPGAVFYAPYDTGVFEQITTLSVPGDAQFTYMTYPGGLVVGLNGTRRVWVFSEDQGLLLEQELPITPVGDGASASDIKLRLLCYVPQSAGPGHIGLAIGSSVSLTQTPIFQDGEAVFSVVGATFTELVEPGQQMTLRSGFYAVGATSAATSLTGLAADVYDKDLVFCASRSYALDPQIVHQSGRGGDCLSFYYTDADEVIH